MAEIATVGQCGQHKWDDHADIVSRGRRGMHAATILSALSVRPLTDAVVQRLANAYTQGASPQLCTRLPERGGSRVCPNRVRLVRSERPLSGGAVVSSNGHSPNAFLRFGAVTALLTCATLALSSSHRASE